MKKKFMLFAMLIFSVVAGFAQSNSYIGVKIGVGNTFGYTKCENIRSDNLGFFYTKYGPSAWMLLANVEVSYIKFTNNKRFGFSGGLRYNGIDVYLPSSKHVFVYQDNNTIYSFELNKLSQYVYYLGVPLGVEFVATNPEAIVRLIFNVGANFDFKVGSSVSVEIRDVTTSEEHINKVIENLEKPSSFCFSTYVGMGIRIGRPNKINGSITYEIPYYGYNAIGFASERFGLELSGSVHFPLK